MKPKEVAALMGQLVVVDKELVRKYQGTYPNGHYAWEVAPLPLKDVRTGWIVGSTRLQNGEKEYHGYEEGITFKQTGPTTLAILVCFWPNQRPVRVPLEGFRMATPNDSRPHVGAFTWDEASKDQQREIMRAHQRDAQGRWIKGGYRPEVANV